MATDDIKRLIELGVNADPALRELQKLGKETEKQTSQLDGLQKQLSGFAAGIKGTFAGLGISEAINQVVDGIKRMIDEFDLMTDASQAVGVTVGQLQELRYALKLGGNLSDAESNQVLTRLSDKLAEINDESSNTARIFREMGITVNDTVDSALTKMADVFANAPDGIDKTALAVEIFGRNLGQKMVPALNSGAQGIAELRDELHKLGGVIDDETAQQAATFNDNIDKLSIATAALGRSITADLLPPLVEWTNKMVEATKEGNLLNAMIQRYWENSADFWTKAGRAMGLTNKETNAELREQAAAWDKLAADMDKARAASARAGAAPVPKVTEPKPAKEKKGGKSTKEEISELEQWWKSLMKAQEALDNTPAKVEKLNAELSKLAAAGQAGSAWAKKLQEELLKLQPDPVATALKKINDEIAKMADSPKIIAGLSAEMERLQAAGPPAGEAVRKMHDEVLKLRAAQGDTAAQVQLDLQKQREAQLQNIRQEEEWQDLLATGQISVQEYSDGIAKYYSGITKEQDKAIEKTKDYGDILEEWSGKFTTDFIDEMIDGMGKADQSFTDMIESMLKQLAKLFVQMQVAQAFKAMGGGWGGLFKSAQGNAWAGPGVEAMASGGILSSPTFFRNGPRLAVAGEAGPEAVVPLQRNASGDLGVSASPVNIVINNNNPDAEVTARPKDNGDGQRTVEIWVERKVRAMMTDGSMDRTMRQSYGVTRQPTAG